MNTACFLTPRRHLLYVYLYRIPALSSSLASASRSFVTKKASTATAGFSSITKPRPTPLPSSKLSTVNPLLRTFQTHAPHRTPDPTSTTMSLSSNDRDTRNLSEAEKHQVHRNRMDRPPYSLADASKPFERIYEGSCFCQKVKFAISRETPLDAKYCHCKGCQQLHGAPFQWAAIFHKGDVHIYEGQDQLIYWNSPEKSTEYILPCKVYCNHCRAPIMDEGRNMILLFPTLIHFKNAEEKKRFKPSCHIFYSRRCIDVPDGIPKWEAHKDDSRRIPETFDEEKKAYAEGKIEHKHDDREHMD